MLSTSSMLSAISTNAFLTRHQDVTPEHHPKHDTPFHLCHPMTCQVNYVQDELGQAGQGMRIAILDDGVNWQR